MSKKKKTWHLTLVLWTRATMKKHTAKAGVKKLKKDNEGKENMVKIRVWTHLRCCGGILNRLVIPENNKIKEIYKTYILKIPFYRKGNILCWNVTKKKKSNRWRTATCCPTDAFLRLQTWNFSETAGIQCKEAPKWQNTWIRRIDIRVIGICILIFFSSFSLINNTVKRNSKIVYL